MSATMGNPKYFLKTIGGKNGRYNRIRSTFNFDKSPIYLYAGKRMGYKDIDRNLPWLASEVDTILRKHPKESGIIHSGSYHLAKKIYDGLPRDMQKRVLLYDGTEGKITALSTFEREDNLILMGPSLLEGIDLKGDKSRFQLFVKVPYPSLANKFIKRKMETQSEWYRWKTCTSILQGVGRSVREDGDWAVTYILDSCFYDLLKEDLAFPGEFKDRIIHLK
jgi:Rad3-related DNA helicase